MISARCCLLVAMTVAAVLAQPQGGRRYLPPGQGGYNGGGQRPSTQYGVPQNNLIGGGNGGYQNGGGNGGYQNGGANSQDDDLAEPANYEFSYEVQDAESGNDFGHRESRQGDEATGSYHVLLPDGRTQIVDYVANAEGYMPTIRYEGGDNANGQQNDGAYAAAGGLGNGQGGYPRGPSGNSQGGYNAGSRSSQGGYNAGSRSSQGGYNAGSRSSQGGYNAGSRSSQGGYNAGSGSIQGGYNAGSRSSQGGYNAGSRSNQGGYNAGSRSSQGGYNAGARNGQQGGQGGYRY